MASLYVHVPFCPTLCPYCDFHVVRRAPGWVEAYLKRLREEAQGLYLSHPEPLATLYLGGGTPSFLRDRELLALFQALPWRLERGAEVTLEANPGTLNRERLALLKDLGVNRLSLGVQSFQEGVLKFLGRAHGRKGALKAVELALEGGFRVSLDLILGLPMQDVEQDLAEAAALGVGHVSAYTLQVERGTPFALMGLKEDPEREAWAMERAEEVLGEAGLLRYEVSNFARPGEEARHNQVYWQNGFWLALGPGATGQYPGGGSAYAFRRTHPPLLRWPLAFRRAPLGRSYLPPRARQGEPHAGAAPAGRAGRGRGGKAHGPKPLAPPGRPRQGLGPGRLPGGGRPPPEAHPQGLPSAPRGGAEALGGPGTPGNPG